MFSVKRVTFEDKANKTCTNLESAKRRNADLIKVGHCHTRKYSHDVDTKFF